MSRLSTVALAIAFSLARAQPGGDRPLRIDPLPESHILRKVAPRYPALALRRRIQGTVRLFAIIGQDGRVAFLRLASGHPVLVTAAMEAAKQWVFRPFEQDGRPVRVITRIEVPFRLDPLGNPVEPDPPEAAPPPARVI